MDMFYALHEREHCGKLGHKMDKCYALHKCEHCSKLGHNIDKCYPLYSHPPRSAIVVQTDLPHLHLLGILLLLFRPIHLLCSTNFANGIRINNLLVPLHLSHW